MNPTQKEDLSQYKTWGLTLLQLMGLIAVSGLVGTLVLSYFF